MSDRPAAPMPDLSAEDRAATAGFVLTHTMLRITDPARSLDFYGRALGMRLAGRVDFDDWRFTLFFLQAPGQTPANDGTPASVFARPGLLELTYNWGAEADGSTVHSGNEDPKGFGHICIAVPDLAAACARFEALGVPFQKRPDQGGIKDIAFIRDPDGYWIEVVQPDRMAAILGDKFSA